MKSDRTREPAKRISPLYTSQYQLALKRQTIVRLGKDLDGAWRSANRLDEKLTTPPTA